MWEGLVKCGRSIVIGETTRDHASGWGYRGHVLSPVAEEVVLAF